MLHGALAILTIIIITIIALVVSRSVEFSLVEIEFVFEFEFGFRGPYETTGSNTNGYDPLLSHVNVFLEGKSSLSLSLLKREELQKLNQCSKKHQSNKHLHYLCASADSVLSVWPE